MKTCYFVIVSADADLSKPAFIFGYDSISVGADADTPAITAAPGFRAVYLPWMTADAWPPALSSCQNLALDGEKIVPTAPYIYTPPPLPLKEQAEKALQQARATIYNNYGILNEPTPADWVAYIKALMAIENGTDTTSTALPAPPANTEE